MIKGPVLNLEKRPPQRDEDFLAFIRLRPCCACFPGAWSAGVCPAGSHGVSVAHHFGRTGKGMAQKCSDYETVPLCPRHHTEAHIKGGIRFQAENKIDFETVSDLCKIYGTTKT